METRANHIWVGAVTLVLLAALAAFIIWIARLNEGSQNEYDIFYKQSVSGLARGSEVAYSGVPVGQVSKIALWEKDPEFVRVRIKVDEEVPILQGTTATIQGSFTGVSTILLDGAVRGAPPITKVGPEGVPVIPTKAGGLGAILSSAPMLLERLGTLTERMTMLLSDRNQQSIEGILANSDRVTRGLADTAPQIERTMLTLQGTLQQAESTLAQFERVAGSTDQLLNKEGASLADELRVTLEAAQGSARELEATLGDVRPAAQQISTTTLPAAETAIRELQATAKSLRNITEQIEDRGAGSLLSSDKLPVYEPEKTE